MSSHSQENLDHIKGPKPVVRFERFLRRVIRQFLDTSYGLDQEPTDISREKVEFLYGDDPLQELDPMGKQYPGGTYTSLRGRTIILKRIATKREN